MIQSKRILSIKPFNEPNNLEISGFAQRSAISRESWSIFLFRKLRRNLKTKWNDPYLQKNLEASVEFRASGRDLVMGRQIKSVRPQSQFLSLSLSFYQSLSLNLSFSPLPLSDYQRFAIWCRVIAPEWKLQVSRVLEISALWKCLSFHCFTWWWNK